MKQDGTYFHSSILVGFFCGHAKKENENLVQIEIIYEQCAKVIHLRGITVIEISKMWQKCKAQTTNLQGSTKSKLPKSRDYCFTE